MPWKALVNATIECRPVCFLESLIAASTQFAPVGPVNCYVLLDDPVTVIDPGMLQAP